MATTNNLVKVSQLQTSMQRVKSELNNLDGKNFGGVNIANGKINFFATSDTTKTPIASVDLPEEIYLDQTLCTEFPFQSGNLSGRDQSYSRRQARSRFGSQG